MVLTKGYWGDHVHNLELTLNKLKGEVLKCSIKGSFFGKTKMEHLGFGVTCNGVKPINIKIEEITNINPTTSQNNYEIL